MHYFTQSPAQRKQPAYKLIGLMLIIGFVIYTTHHLIIFASMASEVWFDLFILSSFMGFLGMMLLTDKTELMMIENPQVINLVQDAVDPSIVWGSMMHQTKQLEVIYNGMSKALAGTRNELQQQLLELLKDKITPELIMAFISHFNQLGLEQGGIKQVKSYIENCDVARDLILVKKSVDRLQLSVSDQELVVSQKGLYKKVKPTHDDDAVLKREKYFALQQSYKIKQNPSGAVVKYSEKIVVKVMFRIAIKIALF